MAMGCRALDPPGGLLPCCACAQELELAAYLVHCERRLSEEFERCEAYLGHAIRKPLRDIVDRCLLEAHLPTILEGSKQLLAACQEQDLARLYRWAQGGARRLCTTDSCSAAACMPAGSRPATEASALPPIPPSCSMCTRIGALQGLRLVFRDYIRSAGSAIVTDELKVGRHRMSGAVC